MLVGQHPSHAETAAVAHPLDVELDGLGGVSGAQEVRVQGVHIALRVDGAARRHQRLGGHLAPEDPGVADRVADSDEHVIRTALEVQQLQQGVDRVAGHAQFVSETGGPCVRTPSLLAEAAGDRDVKVG